MKDFEKNIAKYEETNPLSLFYELGSDSSDIKEFIINAFQPYFQNLNNLEESSIDYMVGTWLSFLTIKIKTPTSLQYIDSILEIFNGAKESNSEEALKAYIYWQPEMSQSISRFWSLYNSQVKYRELCIEDFSEYCLRLIGQTIEGLSKPFIKLLLQLNRIKNNKPYDVSEIEKKDLGVAIDEIINTSDLKDILVTQPHGIRFNQWRNIAYHHNTKIINGQIICWCKKGGLHFEFIITKDELMGVVEQTLLFFKLIRISETIFSLDNLKELCLNSKEFEGDGNNLRQEGKLLELYSAISSQGFKVIDLKIADDNAIMKLKDMQDYSEFLKRGIHTSQFLYNLWVFSNASVLEIEYYLNDGEKFFASKITSENFIKTEVKNTTISELLKNVEYTFIEFKFSQNINPFESLELSEEITKGQHSFYSQRGEEITVAQFIEQFAKSVFCNYLVFISEGLGKNEISVNIGSDGSLVVGSVKEEKFVLQVPAIIKNKDLQCTIIKVLEEIIGLFHAKKLDFKLVEHAKTNNGYYYKKTAIKNQIAEIKID